jgi:fumarate reductase subunit C
MSDSASTPYHPRWLRTRTSTYWWLERWSYFAFILREVSSVFVAWFVLYLLMLVRALAHGKAWYEAFLGWSGHPLVMALNLITLFFVVFHAVTWFNLAPKAMVVSVAGRRVPGAVIAGSNYAAWALVSAMVAWFLLRG